MVLSDGYFEGRAHNLSLALHYFVKHFIHLSKRRLESIDDTIDIPYVVFVHASRRRLSKGVPVIPAVLELWPQVGQSQVLQDDANFSDVGLKADIMVHDLLGELPHVGLQAEVQEENVIQLLRVWVIVMVVNQIRAEIQSSLHLAKDIVILKVLLQVVHMLVRVTVHMPPRFSQKLVEIIRWVYSLEDRQIVLEATNNLKLVPWLLGDLPLVNPKTPKPQIFEKKVFLFLYPCFPLVCETPLLVIEESASYLSILRDRLINSSRIFNQGDQYLLI